MTDDLPTPPLPDDRPSTRVLEPGSAKGMVGRGVAVLALRAGPAAPAGVGLQLGPHRGPLLVGHHREVDVDAGRRPSRALTAVVTRSVISARSGQPATVRATVTPTRAAVDADALDHVEVDDAAVQLGVLDRAAGRRGPGLR